MSRVYASGRRGEIPRRRGMLSLVAALWFVAGTGGCALAGQVAGMPHSLRLAWQAPPLEGPPADLGAIAFLSANLGFGATRGGAIYETVDGGIVWRVRFRDPRLAFEQLAFPTVRQGYAVGCLRARGCRSLVLAVTTDGGRTWQTFRPEGLAAPPARLDLDFVGERLVFATVAGRARMWVSVDGARHWRSVLLPRPWLAVGAPSFIDARRGFAVVAGDGNWAILATKDQGRHWSISVRSAAPLTSVQFVTSRLGFAAGGFSPYSGRTPRQLLLESQDGGRTWQVRYRQDRSGVNFAQLYFVNQEQGWATTGPCPDGQAVPCTAPLLYTANGGQSFRIASQDTVVRPSVLGDMAFYVTDGWPFGSSAALLHSVAEGGRVRTLTKQPGALLASSVQFVGQDALLITNAGFFRSTDAGRTWVRWPLAPPVVRTATVVYEGGEDLLDLSATPFLQSHDGGKSWQDVALPTGLAVGDQVLPEAYAVAAPGDVWLVLEDQHGRQDLVRSRDAGRTWALASSSVPASYATALAARGEEGFVVGPRPNELSRTEDAGRRWQRVAVFPLRWRITSVSLGGPGDVWLTMWDSNHLRTMLMHSSDGGVHWQMSVAQNAALTDVTFADAQHGWLLTAPGPKPGNLFRSSDGGRRFSEVWPVLLPAPQMSGSS